jgi:hypothetical protein
MLLSMRVAAQMDGTYSLIEIAPVVGVPESTLFRYRWQGRLLTAYDFMVDQELRRRIETCAIFGRELSVVLPDAKFDLEDCTRLRVIGSLGQAGWDRAKLLDVLAWPWALPTETSGDGHSPRYAKVMPTTLAIYATRHNPKSLARDVFNSRAEAERACRGFAFSFIVDIDAIRHSMRVALADVERERERKAEQIARDAAKKNRNLRYLETEEQLV